MLKYKGTHLSYVRTCTLLLLRRPAISETPYRRLPVFYLITGIGDNIVGNYVKSTSRLPILKCTPITVTQDVASLEYTPSFNCVILAWGYLPGRRLSTFYWTLGVYSRPGYSRVGCKLRLSVNNRPGYSRVGCKIRLSVCSRPGYSRVGCK